MIPGMLLIGVGLEVIVFGFTADAFYGAFIRRPRPDEKPAPKWLGRIIFFAVGVWSIYSGISHLLHSSQSFSTPTPDSDNHPRRRDRVR